MASSSAPKNAREIEHDGVPTLPKGLTEVPVRDAVGEYPERPYGEAVTDAHRKELAEAGVVVDKKTVTEQDAVAATS